MVSLIRAVNRSGMVPQPVRLLRYVAGEGTSAGPHTLLNSLLEIGSEPCGFRASAVALSGPEPCH